MSEEVTSNPPMPIRDERGRLLPGARLPGGGRPPGKSQATLVRELIEPHRAALIDRTIELALKAQDGPTATRALELALSRLAPAPRQESEKVSVPGLAEADGFGPKCEAIISAVSRGEISAEAGERVLRLLDVYRRAVEHDDLAKRISALEAGKRIRTIDVKASGVGDLL